MVITTSRAMLTSVSVCTTTVKIEAALPQQERAAFRRFANVMNPPADAPRCAEILNEIVLCVIFYRDSLGDCATESLNEIISEVLGLARAIYVVDLLPSSGAAMRRRISRSPAWGLFIDLTNKQPSPRVREGIGAAVCWSWSKSTRFSESLSHKLRRAIDNNEDIELPTSVPGKQLASAVRNANTIFHTNTLQQINNSDPKSFASEVRQWFRNRIFLASDKTQQATFHHRTQSRAQFLASARWLRQRAEAGDNLTIQACIGGILGLRADMVARIPVLDTATDDAYVVAIDVNTGCLHFAVSLFADGGAVPPLTSDPGAIESSESIFVTPFPEFLADALRRKRGEKPGVQTLGGLVSSSISLDSRTKTLEQAARIAPSFARFCNTVGPFAVSIGIDRYIAAVLCHDPRLVPTGKFFYARANREELWNAATSLFCAMEWGPAVQFVNGFAAGSKVTPTRETILAWFMWMTGQVEAKRPGASPTKDQIIKFHNEYAMLVASLISFVLALRERKQIPLKADVAMTHGLTLPIGDKRCGMIRGPRSVPLPAIANSLLKMYFDHVIATDKLLGDLTISADASIRRRFKQIFAGARIPIFTIISRGRHKAIGSLILEKWWPQHLGLVGNHGRHYIQNNLRAWNVLSNDVDFYVRHMLRGIAPCSSSSTKSLRAMIDVIVPALDALLKELGLEAIPGLTTLKKTAD